MIRRIAATALTAAMAAALTALPAEAACPHSVMTRCLLCGAPGSKHDVHLQ